MFSRRRRFAGFAQALLVCSSLTVVMLPGPVQAASNPVEIFLRTYTYCDAERLAVLWNRTSWEMKQIMGTKLLQHRMEDVSAAVNEARANGRPCAWGDTGWSYQDAQLVAAYWHLSVRQAKLKVAQGYTVGDWQMMQYALEQARS